MAAPPRRKGFRGPPVFTEAEQAALRSSLRTGRHVLGSWAALAAAMYVHTGTIERMAQGKGKPITPEIAVRLAKALRVPLEAITRPGLHVVRDSGPMCPTCGGAA